MATIQFQVDGLRELQQALARAGIDAVPKLRTAMGSAALIVQNAAKIKAPYKSGNLRRSIHHEVTTEQGQVEAIVGTNVEYARRMEYGFAGRDSRGRLYNQPAKPYLRPALEENRERVIREINEALRDLLP